MGAEGSGQDIAGKARLWPVVPRDTAFDNREYWETRYATDPERGSGKGSRGRHLNRKRRLLDQVISEVRPASILDVGCGDLEVVADISFSGTYTGIDLSPTILERNRALRPDWNFIAGDFVELARQGGLEADLVICLDVLIHQIDADTYREFVRELVNVTRKTAIVNGFGVPFTPGKPTRICAFHEPIMDSFAALGPHQLQVVATQRGTDVIRLDKL
jgi:SAM-dependent methyltransferase